MYIKNIKFLAATFYNECSVERMYTLNDALHCKAYNVGHFSKHLSPSISTKLVLISISYNWSAIRC